MKDQVILVKVNNQVTLTAGDYTKELGLGEIPRNILSRLGLPVNPKGISTRCFHTYENFELASWYNSLK